VNERNRDFAVLILASVVVGVGVWALFHYTHKFRRVHPATEQPLALTRSEADLWNTGVERVKEDRGQTGQVGISVPPELKHYSDTHWFLATQIAEVKKHKLENVQDFLDVAAMIQRGDLVAVPAATENYILLGVGASADGGAFTRYEDDHTIGIYNEAQLRDEYTRLDASRANIQKDIAALQSQMHALKRAERKKQAELQKQITARQQDLKSTEDEKALFDRSYGEPATRQKLFEDYQTLQTLAKNFHGRSYNLDDSSDRQAFKINLLRSLRPAALKILEEVAAAYHQKFDRPLPISSLVRPEEYQHALHRVNRNAVLIDTPPHSTGLAFDIDYRYMSGEEQNFLMNELAGIKDEGRIEVLRERTANYHVFAFINGTRPSDELIAASLDEAQANPPAQEAHHVGKKPAEKAKGKEQRGSGGNTKAKRRR
jgi:Family of unknown function (DUF5715)